MLSRIVRAISILSLILSCLTMALADDPFVGKWKLNASKSKMSGLQMKIEALGGNKYKFTYGARTYTIVADGTDQSIPPGLTRAITQEQPNVWRVVDKKDGNTLASGTWTLSPDGKIIDLHITGKSPDGSPIMDDHVTRYRIAGSSGFAGTWEDRKVKIGWPREYELQPFDGDGLTFLYPAEKSKLSMKFDGKDYEETGPYAAPGSTSSGHRVNDRTIEFTDKVQGKVMDTSVMTLSPDGKTLNVYLAGEGSEQAP